MLSDQFMKSSQTDKYFANHRGIPPRCGRGIGESQVFNLSPGLEISAACLFDSNESLVFSRLSMGRINRIVLKWS